MINSTEIKTWHLIKSFKPVDKSVIWVSSQDEPGRWGVWQCVYRKPYFMSVTNMMPLEFIKGLSYYWTYDPPDLPEQAFEKVDYE